MPGCWWLHVAAKPPNPQAGRQVGRQGPAQNGPPFASTQVSYILAVNPSILATTGGTCDPKEVCSVSQQPVLAGSVCVNWPCTAAMLGEHSQDAAVDSPPSLPPLPPQTDDFDLLGPQCLSNPVDEGAQQCMAQLMRSLITATAASSLISTFFIGYFGNLPLALAPGIGEPTGSARANTCATGGWHPWMVSVMVLCA